MRRVLFTHLQTLSFSFYNVTPVGYILTRVMSDTNRIASMIAWNMTDILWAMFLRVWHLCRHAGPQLAAGVGGHPHRAGHCRAHRLLPEPDSPLEPESSENQLPDHRRLQRRHHRRQNLQNPGH